ncbi:MAG TPA: hypothetical protein VL547_20410 [Dinghuibacter sp.]|jgi:hypothetical protein|uniref:hypothetical protein n=1 Tax=Dinghuibacter sp. TaxID=2024697 RepID=UPI002CCF02E3|nr:hypothetical protein [Dinghuibacter sp.]HTJ14418.1 hypothetical protein [Dinghuibacter sp.]
MKPAFQKDPEAVLTGFFGSYTLSEARLLLWEMASQALCASDDELGEFSRKELLAGYEALDLLLEAAHCVSGIYN